ncbi:MAG: hypothetical protein VZR95_03665 [Alphaproteobacteria bacterium]
MKLYQINIRPSGGFYSQIKGDMLFGMFCWAIIEKFGQDRLISCLDGYTQNRPFIVFSDAFPQGWLPKPTLPFTYYRKQKQNDDDSALKRKDFKRKNWLPLDKIGLSTLEMTEYFNEVPHIKKSLYTSVHLDPIRHHTTGGQYSAYTTEKLSYAAEVLSIYVLIDEERIKVDEVQQLMELIGHSGYGKKASSGNGKFEITGDILPFKFTDKPSDSYLTLAPCVPQPDVFNSDKSFYHIFVRFGKHGNQAAHSNCPFKKPVMTAETGAVFTFALAPSADNVSFIGTGINNISQTEPATVFQGYAPVIPLQLKEAENDK